MHFKQSIHPIIHFPSHDLISRKLRFTGHCRIQKFLKVYFYPSQFHQSFYQILSSNTHFLTILISFNRLNLWFDLKINNANFLKNTLKNPKNHRV